MSRIMRMKNSINNLPNTKRSKSKRKSMDIHSIHRIKPSNKPIKSVSEIEKILSYDKPAGNGLSKIDGIFEFDKSNAVELKKVNIKGNVRCYF